MKIEDIKRSRAFAHHIAQARDAARELGGRMGEQSLEIAIRALEADLARIEQTPRRPDGPLTAAERESLRITEAVITLGDEDRKT